MTNPSSNASLAVACVDLGASSGRIYRARLRSKTVELTEIARFANYGIRAGGVLYWDLLRIYREILAGIKEAQHGTGESKSQILSVGIDSWAVDYGVVGPRGNVISQVVHHRDSRTQGIYEAVFEKLRKWDIYQHNGIALHRFNTMFQLLAEDPEMLLDPKTQVLLVPDLLNFLLSGEKRWEVTNASTTGLMTSAGVWDDVLFGKLSIPRSVVGEVVSPGGVLGPIISDEALYSGISPRMVVSHVASHDTASAVLAVPSRGDAHSVFISSGTWSLLGVELGRPIISRVGMGWGFSNELGVAKTIRYLKNVMGFWLLQQLLVELSERGIATTAKELSRAGGRVEPLRFVLDAEDERLLAPKHMSNCLSELSVEYGSDAPSTPEEFMRTILDSLALSYRRGVRQLIQLTGREFDIIHIVGGGALNVELCQLTADACGIPVVAGPVEAAALGNALMQMVALGEISPDLGSLREVVRNSSFTTTYEPNAEMLSRWAEVEGRVFGYERWRGAENL